MKQPARHAGRFLLKGAKCFDYTPVTTNCEETSMPRKVNWQTRAAKREPFAWRVFQRTVRKEFGYAPSRIPCGYEWEWFLRGWKARIRNKPLKGMLAQMRFWGS
jgi:hypothetical protein